MKIVQVNGWLGRLNTPLSKFIAEEEPEIVCLQEAMGPKSKPINNFYDQFNFLDELIEVGKFKHVFFAPAWGFEMAGQIIDEGNAILSKYPISKKQAFHTFDTYHLKEALDNKRVNARVWQACTLKFPESKELSVTNYQGYLPGADSIGDETSVHTMEKVRDMTKKLSKPLIFCGDLNVVKESPAFAPIAELGLRDLTAEYRVKTTLSNARRAPNKDSVVVDYILCSQDIKVNSFRVAEEIISDHKALILEFDL